ncbi:MAG: hypothetical protein NTV51_00325 [Verrucomicrobia bacterium]|nr:hypothetical protein [Verrucomicrobiota bacterium]
MNRALLSGLPQGPTMAKSSTSFVKGKSGNPSGGPRLTPALRKARELLDNVCGPESIEGLRELMRSDDEKVKATVCLGVAKMVFGEHTRAAVDEDGKTVGKIDAEEIAQRARTLIAARLLVERKD